MTVIYLVMAVLLGVLAVAVGMITALGTKDEDFEWEDSGKNVTINVMAVSGMLVAALAFAWLAGVA